MSDAPFITVGKRTLYRIRKRQWVDIYRERWRPRDLICALSKIRWIRLSSKFAIFKPALALCSNKGSVELHTNYIPVELDMNNAENRRETKFWKNCRGRSNDTLQKIPPPLRWTLPLRKGPAKSNFWVLIGDNISFNQCLLLFRPLIHFFKLFQLGASRDEKFSYQLASRQSS
jgi:hypothetical protein